jgi:hypothetical protein
MDRLQRRTGHRERHRMLARVARLEMRRVIVGVVMRRWPMLVCSQPVMVLGMVMIGICVNVQRGDLAGRPGPDQCEQHRRHARHNPECI